MILPFYAIATSSMSEVTVEGYLNDDDLKDYIQCGAYDESSDTIDYKCILNVSREEKKVFDVVDNNECRYFGLSIPEKGIIKVNCGVYINSNEYYYMNNGNDWILFKYEYFSGVNSPDDEGDSFIVDSNVLKSLKRSLFYDVGGTGNRMISMGYIKKKTNLYDKNYNKEKMYLIKGDKVLVLDATEDSKNNKWYQIYFKGKKEIIAWVKSNNVENLSVPSKFLTFDK